MLAVPRQGAMPAVLRQGAPARGAQTGGAMPAVSEQGGVLAVLGLIRSGMAQPPANAPWRVCIAQPLCVYPPSDQVGAEHCMLAPAVHPLCSPCRLPAFVA